MSWRGVPLPPRIAALPRERRGFPVNYVAEWSSGFMRIEPEARYGWNRLTCSSIVGEGEVQLGKVCPEATWRCMADRLCGACGQAIDEGEEAYFLGSAQLTSFTEAPVHYECAAYSAQVCPGVGVTTSRPTGVRSSLTYTLKAELSVLGNPVGDGDPFSHVAFLPMDDPMLAVAAGPPYAVTRLVATPDTDTTVPVVEFVASLPSEMRAP